MLVGRIVYAVAGYVLLLPLYLQHGKAQAAIDSLQT